MHSSNTSGKFWEQPVDRDSEDLGFSLIYDTLSHSSWVEFLPSGSQSPNVGKMKINSEPQSSAL